MAQKETTTRNQSRADPVLVDLRVYLRSYIMLPDNSKFGFRALPDVAALRANAGTFPV